MTEDETLPNESDDPEGEWVSDREFVENPTGPNLVDEMQARIEFLEAQLDGARRLSNELSAEGGFSKGRFAHLLKVAAIPKETGPAGDFEAARAWAVEMAEPGVRGGPNCHLARCHLALISRSRQLESRLVALERDPDQGVGFSASGEMSSGELPLLLNIEGREGTVYLSREMWEALGEKADWLADTQEGSTKR